MKAKISVNQTNLRDNAENVAYGELPIHPVILVQRDTAITTVRRVEILDGNGNVVAEVKYDPTGRPQVYVEASSVKMYE